MDLGSRLTRGNSIYLKTPSTSSLIGGSAHRRASTARSLQGDMGRGMRLIANGPALGSGSSRFGLSQSANQQGELQELNKRLASYLNKVKTLESANKELDIKIKGILANKGVHTRDWSSYEKPVLDVSQQVQDTNLDNAGLTLQLDNCELASDDFKVKWQSELDLRQSVEQDLNGLRRILDDTNLGRGQLEAQIDVMNEELIFLRKNHLEKVDDLRAQISKSDVSVQLEDSEEDDLGQVINKIREEYQALADQNKKKAEECYKKKFDAASQEVSKTSEALQAIKQSITEQRRQIKILEVELRMLGATIHSLEDTLQDTEDRSALELQRINNTIASLEHQLAKLQEDMKVRAADYQDLLNIKMRLQAEIDTYRKLLEGDGLSKSDQLKATPTFGEARKGTKKVIIISQRFMDGKVISEKQESEEILE